MNQDFQDIKNELDKHDSGIAEDVALALYEDLVKRLSPYFFKQDGIYKRRLLQKLEEGEKEMGTQQKFDWLEAFNRNKPEGR